MKYKIMETVSSVDIDGQRYLMDSKTANYFSLDPISIYVWEMLKESNDFETIVIRVVAEYNAQKEDVIVDIQSFIHDLIENGLLKVVS
ncbi:PqqD family protein [Brevibacillus antibioticus]|uniref:PqqD family protein n=1 Tax=Brevibacillus antibioticus TaxID=2570228 RepID=UPI00138FD069|nr:PqqD family protein [Brevibacillus antibioticus]